MASRSGTRQPSDGLPLDEYLQVLARSSSGGGTSSTPSEPAGLSRRDKPGGSLVLAQIISWAAVGRSAIIRPMNLPESPRILIVKLTAIGDVIHALPVACALRDAWPKAHLAWLVEGRAADLLRGSSSA